LKADVQQVVGNIDRSLGDTSVAEELAAHSALILTRQVVSNHVDGSLASAAVVVGFHGVVNGFCVSQEKVCAARRGLR
jgi:hypothetical protein